MTISNKLTVRGWPFLASWAHRISGVVLVIYVWFHIYTLNSLHFPTFYDSKMKVFNTLFFVVLEWLLGIPVIYHALNGGRLVLYEIYENRKDDTLLKWTFSLSFVYLSLLGLFMVIGNQQVSALFFWGYMVVIAICLAYATISKIRSSGASLPWKLQRITGAYLFLMVPAHMIFVHLNPAMGHDAQMIIERMGNPFIKIVDFTLLAGTLYHGAYGLYSISCDYFRSTLQRTIALALISLGTLVFGWIGVKLIVCI